MLNSKAFVGYIVAGDPDLETSLDLMHLSVDSGIDILEIGVPFTDPIAEGPTIQQAHDRSLENDTNLQKIIELVGRFREKDNETPIILMGYINNFLTYKGIFIVSINFVFIEFLFVVLHVSVDVKPMVFVIKEVI